ncbi:MAG: hypothetical protein HYU99_10520 [Deltaproteobacteria bacterium]|nr:hypothetical protein [Deltaproteobacteria bacterium]
MQKKNKLFLPILFLTLLAAIACSGDGNGESGEPVYYYAQDSLTEGSDQEEGYYLKSYEFAADAEDPIYIKAGSNEFTPVLKIFHEEELVAESEGVASDSNYPEPGYMVAVVDTTAEQAATYRVVVTTTSLGATGEFIVELIDCCTDLADDPQFQPEFGSML